MNWNNLDLTDDSHERDANLFDALSFEGLLLEINCNIKDINHKTVTEQFNEDLSWLIINAKEVFEANLDNIVKQAKKERNAK